MSARVAVFVLAASVAAVWLWRRSQTSAPTVGPSGAIGATIASVKVQNVAKAIARAEGFYVSGSIPARANNPGNLKNGGRTLGDTGITIYESAEQGFAALHRQLNLIIAGQSAYYSLNTTIRQMGQKWTATAHEQLAWATNVAKTIGVSVDSTLGSVLT